MANDMTAQEKAEQELKPFVDIAGNEIHEGAILEMYHFTAHHNRKQFMYKQVRGYKKYNDGTIFLEIYHLPLNNKKDWFFLKDKDAKLMLRVLSCNCEQHTHTILRKGNWNRRSYES